ncbi:MAG: sigma-70 family RNA polymerase sigma factor [Acidobacteriota bacterium]
MPAQRRRKPAPDYEEDPVKIYLREVGAVPPLSAVEEARLLRRILSGERAKCRLVESNLTLVVAIARRCAHPSVHLLDLIQTGNDGLMRAASTFDMASGKRFATFARKRIREAIQQHLEQSLIRGGPSSAELSTL